MLKGLGFFFAILITHSLSYGLSIDTLKTNAMKISKILDTSLIVVAPGSIDKGQKVIIVRFIPEDDEYETIATGKVISIKGKIATIQMEMENLKKQPIKSDVAYLLGQPKKFPLVKDGKKEKISELQNTEIEVFEPGYLWFQYISLSSKLETVSSNQANSFKNINKMPKSGFEFEWFFDFIPNYGVNYSLLTGKVPIKSYYRNSVDADYTQNTLKLMYRFKKSSNFRWIFYFQSMLEGFNTDNPDEYVISSLANSNSLGISIYWEPGDLLYQSKSSSLDFTFLRVQYLYGLGGTVQDGFQIQRGTKGTIDNQELKVGTSATVYLPWMPVVKRWTLTVDSYQRTTKMVFSGVTKSEGGFYEIPEGGQYTEKDAGLTIGLGFRFDDFVGRVFKPKN